MEAKVYVQLIFLCVLDIFFFFSGVVLNTLVIITILKLRQLRKKLCNFMIMMLSCFDLLAVVAFDSILLLYLFTRITENYDVFNKYVKIYWHLSQLSSCLSMNALMLMCIERYLGVYYPIFHRTSVTRRRLITSLIILNILPATLLIISTNDLVISFQMALSIFLAIFLPPFNFINYKLFKISTEMQRKKEKSPGKRRINLKDINTCLLVVACHALWSIANCFYLVFIFVNGSTGNSVDLSGSWAGSLYVINCSFNSLIIFWKNKLLRAEGIKIVRTMKERVLGKFSGCSLTTNEPQGQ